MNPIDPTNLDQARDTLRKHLPHVALCLQLQQLEEELAQRDARIAELERSRPVGDWPEARAVHDLISRCQFPWDKIKAWHYGAILVRSLEAFASSAPPAPSPVREVVVESAEARRLREAWNSAHEADRHCVADNWVHKDAGEIGTALRAFCESAPPASAPSDEAAGLRRQLSESLDREARLRAQLVEAGEVLVQVRPKHDAYNSVCEVLGVEGNLIETVKGLRAQLDERTRQVAQLQDDLCDAQYARDKAQADLGAVTSSGVAADDALYRGNSVRYWYDKAHAYRDSARQCVELRAELAALKSAPVRFEREVDAELRAALKACCEWTRPGTRILHALDRWLAAPLSAPDEYTRAAVAWAEESASGRSLTAINVTAEAFLALYRARHSAAASAPALSEWSDERTLELDGTVVFSDAYDFKGLERRCQEARGPDGRYIVWPSGGKWSLYRESDGALAFEAYASADEAKAECERMAKSAAQRIAASAPDGEKAAPDSADGERVTVYFPSMPDRSIGSARLEADYARLARQCPEWGWLALDARVVREGGGK